MRIEQGTGLVDLRHFHLRYRWSICSDADQLAVWGGRDATPVAELEQHRTVPCGCRVCACFVLCNAVVGELESPAEKNGCERHGLEMIGNPPLLALVPSP